MTSEATSEIETKQAAGLAHKDAGNGLFKKGEFQNALKEYHYALLYLRGNTGRGAAEQLTKAPATKETEEEVDELDKDLSVIQSNMAACHMRLGRYDRVIECAAAALKANPFNKKAKFRQAQGYVREGAIPKAEKILDELEKESPDDVAYAAERRNIVAKNAEAEARQRKEMAGMFDRGNKKASEGDSEAAAQED